MGQEGLIQTVDGFYTSRMSSGHIVIDSSKLYYDII